MHVYLLDPEVLVQSSAGTYISLIIVPCVISLVSPFARKDKYKHILDMTKLIFFSVEGTQYVTHVENYTAQDLPFIQFRVYFQKDPL
jgi:hypothetical protein